MFCFVAQCAQKCIRKKKKPNVKEKVPKCHAMLKKRERVGRQGMGMHGKARCSGGKGVQKRQRVLEGGIGIGRME